MLDSLKCYRLFKKYLFLSKKLKCHPVSNSPLLVYSYKLAAGAPDSKHRSGNLGMKV